MCLLKNILRLFTIMLKTLIFKKKMFGHKSLSKVLDGHARKWFKELHADSQAGIEQLDETFLKHWGDRRDFVYYITEFRNLRKQSSESVSDFTKRFNRMYGKIPAEIKPSDASAKITYSDAFDSDFFLLPNVWKNTSRDKTFRCFCQDHIF
jgi:hypothetical protein